MSLRTSTPRLGTDGERKLIPHSGDAPVPQSRESRHSRGSDAARRRTLIAYSLGLGVLAVAVALGLLAYGATLGNPWVVVALCAAAVLTDRASVRLSETTDLTASPVVTLFAAVLFGPLAGGLVGAASELGDAELLRRSGTNRAPASEMAYLHEHAVHLRRRDGVDRSGNPRPCRLNGWIVLGHDRRFCGRRSLGNRVRGTHADWSGTGEPM